MADLSSQTLSGYSPLPVFFLHPPLFNHLVDFTRFWNERYNLKITPKGGFLRWIVIWFFCTPYQVSREIIFGLPRKSSYMKVHHTVRNDVWRDENLSSYSGIFITHIRNPPCPKIKYGRWGKLSWNWWFTCATYSSQYGSHTWTRLLPYGSTNVNALVECWFHGSLIHLIINNTPLLVDWKVPFLVWIWLGLRMIPQS